MNTNNSDYHLVEFLVLKPAFSTDRNCLQPPRDQATSQGLGGFICGIQTSNRVSMWVQTDPPSRELHSMRMPPKDKSTGYHTVMLSNLPSGDEGFLIVQNG